MRKENHESQFNALPNYHYQNVLNNMLKEFCLKLCRKLCLSGKTNSEWFIRQSQRWNSLEKSRLFEIHFEDATEKCHGQRWGAAIKRNIQCTEKWLKFRYPVDKSLVRIIKYGNLLDIYQIVERNYGRRLISIGCR